MKQSWKTTIAGLIGGLPPIITALIDAYNSGAFTGKDTSGVVTGIAIIAIGTLAKDFNKTGLPTDKDNGTTTN